MLRQPSERRLPGARTAERGGTRCRTSERRRRRAKRRTPSGLAVGPSASTHHNRRDRQCANGGSADGVACTTPRASSAHRSELPPNLLIGKRPESGLFRMTSVGIDRIGGFDSAIPRFESWRPSQPVRSLRCDFQAWENRRHSRGLAGNGRVFGEENRALPTGGRFPGRVSAA